ncbi:MAG: hypothetical protein ACJ8CR_29185 [Roseiflexaceae bacterium]
MNDIYTHRIEIYTASLLIAGAYDLTIYRRVSDAINGEQRRYIPLRDATIAPIERAQQAQQVPHLLVDRHEALLVATVQEATPPLEYAREEQMRGVVPIVAMFFTAAFVVRATFYKRPDLTLPEALERFNDDFVPLREIQVFPLLSSFPPLQRDFAALARERIVAFYLVSEPPPISPPAPPAQAAPTAEPAPVGEPLDAVTVQGDAP